ncbi:MAG: UDP-glucose 4-epimerase [Marmoricola sp.]|nr:UDP-glucose 4-epimerase [Marmoricola sp.]
MAWLVTGGAGYIGSHIVRAFEAVGIRTVVLDDLSSGHREFVGPQTPYVEGSILDTDLVTRTLREHEVTGVVHLAGYKYAGVSVERPLHTYTQNVTGTVTLLEAMAAAGVGNIVFSSSAATYGNPDVENVTEQTPTAPQSPYGETKLIGEWLIRDQAVATGLRFTALRYFNVVGSGATDLYDSSPHNLFPKVFEDLLQGRTPTLFGIDYPTPDGTTVRDYVHVQDLAEGHVAAARRLESGAAIEPVYNLGSGSGSSVREIMDTMREVTEIDFSPTIGARRAGDPARIVASGELARRDLGWAPQRDLREMVESAWQARRGSVQDA